MQRRFDRSNLCIAACFQVVTGNGVRHEPTHQGTFLSRLRQLVRIAIIAQFEDNGAESPMASAEILPVRIVAHVRHDGLFPLRWLKAVGAADCRRLSFADCP